MDYLAKRKNFYSQNGEDGIIEEILCRIPKSEKNSWCVEFGAWDGKHMSNTFHLVESAKYAAIYIEGNSEYFEKLIITADEYKGIHPILAMVSPKNDENSLDAILAKTELPQDYDVLSIDIDTYDLDVWSLHLNYRPKVVVIEINSGIAPGILEWHRTGNRGNSFSATLQVGLQKNYTLLSHTGNMVFVDNAYLDSMDMDPLDIAFPERLFTLDYEFERVRPRSKKFWKN